MEKKIIRELLRYEEGEIAAMCISDYSEITTEELIKTLQEYESNGFYNINVKVSDNDGDYIIKLNPFREREETDEECQRRIKKEASLFEFKKQIAIKQIEELKQKYGL